MSWRESAIVADGATTLGNAKGGWLRWPNALTRSPELHPIQPRLPLVLIHGGLGEFAREIVSSRAGSNGQC